MSEEEAIYQIKQNIKMHEIEGTTSNQNEREKVLLDYITNLQEEKIQLEGKIKQLEHNCKQAENSCRQHRLASKNHIRRLKRREKQINIYKSRIDKSIEYIEKYLHEHIIDDLSDEESKFEKENGIPIPNAKEELLNILQGKEN